MKALLLLETTRTLRIARGGRLLPWLGPAIRGLTGGRLRARVCRLPVAEQIGTQKYCRGCPLMAGCPYGESFEPDPPAGLRIAAGWENTARPLVVAPEFPLPGEAIPGMTFRVRATFLGPVAASHAAAFWEALRIGGADSALGLGEDRILFDVLPGADADVSEEVHVPLQETELPGRVPWVRVGLTSPMFLNETAAEGRQPVFRPTFGQLMRAGLRVLGPLYKLYAEPLPEEVFARVKGVAERVATLAVEFRPFAQRKWSHRTKERCQLRGATGVGMYGPVPRWLVPWGMWAGRVHVGTHRVAGAGGWRLEQPAE